MIGLDHTAKNVILFRKACHMPHAGMKRLSCLGQSVLECHFRALPAYMKRDCAALPPWELPKDPLCP